MFFERSYCVKGTMLLNKYTMLIAVPIPLSEILDLNEAPPLIQTKGAQDLIKCCQSLLLSVFQ